MKTYLMSSTLLASLLFLASCASESDTKAMNGVARPQKLTFSKPALGAPLTKEQAKEIKRVFSQKPSLQIAPSELLLKDRDSKLSVEDLYELQMKEQEFQYMASAESYELYKAMRKNCQKQHATLNFDATIPLEKVTSASDLKTGDHVSSSLVADYNGATCDVEASGKMSYSGKVERLEKDGVASAEAAYSLKALMKNPKYASLLKSRGIVASSSISGVVAKQNVNTESLMDSELNLKFNLDGSYFTLESEIPVNSLYSIYAQPVDEKSALVQAEIHMQVKMPDFAAVVDAQLEGISYSDGRPYKTTMEKYYVNGHEKTVEELRDLFGETLKSEKSLEMTQSFLN